MKKNLACLTGIVFVIVILAAGACGCSNKKNDSLKEDTDPTKVKADSTEVDIFLKAILIDGSMHLEMYESKKPGFVVIDGLITDVYPGYTVTWRKKDNSIKKIEDIRLNMDDGKLFGYEVQEIESERAWKLVIPEVDPDTIKYLIKFTIKEDKDTTYTIDPYLKIKGVGIN